MVLATPNRTKESCIKIIYIIYQNSSTTIFLIIATKVFVNLPITFNIKLPYLARGNGGVVYLPTVRLNLLYIECLQIHVSPSRKPVIFHGPCGNDTLALLCQLSYRTQWFVKCFKFQWLLYFLTFACTYVQIIQDQTNFGGL